MADQSYSRDTMDYGIGPERRDADFYIDDEYVQETEKVIELKDHFGYTHFIVSLHDETNTSTSASMCNPSGYYVVSVTSYCCGKQPLVIISKKFDSLRDARKNFNKYVETYRDIVKAQTRDTEDIRAYRDKINFRVIHPDCCMNCYYAKPITADTCMFDEWKKHKDHFICMNPILRKKPAFQNDEGQDVIPPQHALGDGQNEGQEFDFKMAPYTPANGLCKYYKAIAGHVRDWDVPADREFMDKTIKHEVRKQLKRAEDRFELDVIECGDADDEYTGGND